MKNRVVLAFLVTVALIVPSQVFASGFGYYEHGAKATALAGAFVARADDASAVFYNPAGLAFNEGRSIMVAFHPVKLSASASIMGMSTDTTTPFKPPASFFYSSNLKSFSYGLGVFLPYGLEVKWPEDWIGNQVSYRSYLSTYYIRPAIAFKLNENFAIGGGVDIVYSKVSLSQKNQLSIAPVLPTATIDTVIEGTGNGVGFTVGALLKASDQFQIGAKYQHKVKIEYDGNVDFTPMATGSPIVDGFVNGFLTDQNVKTTITMPAEFVVGAMIKANDKCNIEADIQWTGWSVYDELAISFDNAALDINDLNNWDDSWMFRIGGEYMLSEQLALRAGYIRDMSPTPDNTLKPLLPDADRNEVTMGIGYNSETESWGKMSLDLAFQYIKQDDRTSTFPRFPASYTSSAYIFGIGLGFTF